MFTWQNGYGSFCVFFLFLNYLFYNDYETTDINPAHWHRCSRYHYASQDSLVESCHLNVHIQLQTIIKVHNMLLHHSKLLVLLLIYNDARCVTIILPFVRTSHSFQSLELDKINMENINSMSIQRKTCV